MIKITGPLVLVFVGLAIMVFAWLSGTGPADHNIGRGIANSVMRQAFTLLGGATSLAGAVWLLLRWLDRPGNGH